MAICTVYFNCHGYKYISELKSIKSFADRYTKINYINLGDVLNRGDPILRDIEKDYLREADLLIYQHINTDRGELNHDRIIKYTPNGCIKIGLPHFRGNFYHMISFGELDLISDYSEGREYRNKLVDIVDNIGIRIKKWREFEEKNFSEFMEIEKNSDITMIDYVKSMYKKRRLFQSRGYPTDIFFHEVVRRIISHLKLSLPEHTEVNRDYFAWNQSFPIFPQIAKNLGLEFDWKTIIITPPTENRLTLKTTIIQNPYRVDIYDYIYSMKKAKIKFPCNLVFKENQQFLEELWRHSKPYNP